MGRRIIADLERNIGLGMCFTGRSPLLVDNFDFRMIIYLGRATVNTVESNYSLM